jgi:hypothetical protein
MGYQGINAHYFACSRLLPFWTPHAVSLGGFQAVKKGKVEGKFGEGSEDFISGEEGRRGNCGYVTS